MVDFPPGTGDIQLTLCQTVAFSAAVIVTTPQVGIWEGMCTCDGIDLPIRASFNMMQSSGLMPVWNPPSFLLTTPQKMAFIDVAKGIRMFAKLVVPCVAVVENMSYFDADGKRYFPFGQGSGERIQRDFGLPNLVKFPIVTDLSAAGDGELF